jgi:predicted dithiol-disulfide oxidoreductase (DUF899 family)
VAGHARLGASVLEQAEKESTMSLPQIVSRDEWLAARKGLLAKEKELTRRRDALSSERRNLPMVEIDKEYVFEGPDGSATLLDLFEGRLQLILQHFMFDPSWEDGCPGCTAGDDEVAEGLLDHLHVRDTSFVLVSRAPLEKLEAYKARKGWDVPWYSSHDSDFNYDFGVTVDDSVAPAGYNYATKAEHEARGTGYYFEGDQPIEQPGFSCFLRNGDRIFHTYSTFGRGAEWLGGAYAWLDLTALGRQEEWEKPKGRADRARESLPFFAS